LLRVGNIEPELLRLAGIIIARIDVFEHGDPARGHLKARARKSLPSDAGLTTLCGVIRINRA
jgi:hypothetical protein